MSRLRTWTRNLTIALSVLLLVWCVLGPIGATWNICVCPGRARALADALHTQYPNLEFKGSAGYECTMSIAVQGEADESVRRSIKDSVVNEAGQRGLRHPINLVFSDTLYEYLWLDDPTKNDWRKVE